MFRLMIFQPESDDSALLNTDQLLDESDLNLEQRRLAIEHDDEINNYNVLKTNFIQMSVG